MAIGGVEDITIQRWLLLIMVSLLVFGFWIERNRTNLRSRQFWLVTAIFLAIHLTTWNIALWHLKTVTMGQRMVFRLCFA